MKKSKIALVTGGSGFIGSHLVDQLIERDLRVRVIDNFVGGRIENLAHSMKSTSLEIIDADICEINPTSSFYKDVDVVYHLAGIGDIVPSIERPMDYMKVNLSGTVSVLEGARQNSIRRFVYASSSSCYGIADTPTDERHPIDPKYPYALSKYLGELAAFHWQSIYGLEVNSICIFNAYGPRVKTNGAYGAVLGVFLKQRLEGVPLTLVGDGTQSRDFVHVSDVAHAFYLAGKCVEFGHRFNIGGGNPISILTLAGLIGGNLCFLPKRPGEPEITHADIKKANKILGWSPRKDFVVGINDMLSNIQAWKDAPLWDAASIASATKKWFEYLG